MGELILACVDGDAEKVSLLVSNGVPVNTPYQRRLPLVVASSCGHTRIVEILLRKGAQVNLLDSGGNSALICASSEGHTETVKLLLDHGAQVNFEHNKGFSVLMLASLNGHTETVNYY